MFYLLSLGIAFIQILNPSFGGTVACSVKVGELVVKLVASHEAFPLAMGW